MYTLTAVSQLLWLIRSLVRVEQGGDGLKFAGVAEPL